MALRDALRRPDVTETLHWKLRDYPRRVGARRENPTGFSRGSVNQQPWEEYDSGGAVFRGV